MLSPTQIKDTDTRHGPQQRAVLWALGVVTIASLAALFYDGVVWLVKEWDSPEYSHGFLIPVISAGLVWMKRAELEAAKTKASWSGVAILAMALLVGLVGIIGTIYLLVHIAIVGSIIGLVIAFFGWTTAKILWFPLIYLVFMIPLPDFFLVKLSGEMQLISSSLGVSFIRMLGISVFLEGNIIDLGTFKMQVVEACNGLRYLFPLMSFGFLVGYLHKGPFWQKAVIFLSTIPITIVMNSLRIAVIGALHEFYGIDAASGFLHDFEGWAVFILCLALLYIELRIFVGWNRFRAKRARSAAASGGPAPAQPATDRR